MLKLGQTRVLHWVKLGKYSDAVTACEKALEIDPKYAKGWYNKGVVLSEIGRSRESKKAFKKAKKFGKR